MRIGMMAAIVVCSTAAFAQTVTQQSSGANSPNINGAGGSITAPHDIEVKSSPAEDALIQEVNQMQAIQKAFNDLLQQARTNLDTLNKPIVEQMKARAKKYQDMIDAANKDLQAQVDKNTAAAKDKFDKETADLQSKAVSPQTIKALEEVVKKEQGLPDTAHYDLDQKKWVDTAKK